ncbi:FAD/NAD(P)-binding domain-containing protein [Aulographum hederae CBS 113979]|uniref:FAD/NAD(P)-binding domain-containing protein n=1 Tax=Aulographum hederae CBS 113979 TaxID=1176131 RepID=A0A6G1GS05_9PEZI|nr:FAD/NAD(P)-binding domain-containing protein [Aulographum hederae CBS 113979]
MDITNSTPTYPTRSLQFLKRVDSPSKGAYVSKTKEPAKVKFKVIIAGAGLGGLATAIALALRGHQVTIFEQAKELGEVGAGIQIPSNSSRLLLKWGLGPHFEGKVVQPEGMSFRRWQSGKRIGYTKLVPDFQEKFNAPYYVIHRAHFHEAMHKRALEVGVEIEVDSKIVDYDFDRPSLTLENGSVHAADLIVAADGVKSLARGIILGDKDQLPRMTGFAAYRATVPVEKMQADPDLAWILENNGLHCWIGDLRHVMSYTIAGGKSFNMVLSHPEKSDPSTWRQETALEDMKQQFQGWDFRLTRVIDMVKSTIKWPLFTGYPLDHWVAPSGKALIIGDAAHAMLPYMSQGAAMAVEDGSALATILSTITSKEDLVPALRIFEHVRRTRTSQMQHASLINGRIWHYADGPEQRARDEGMRPEVEGRQFVESPNQWSDPVTQEWCYGYDADAVVLEAWEEWLRKRDSETIG